MITKYTIETDDESADRISATQTLPGQSQECSDEQLPQTSAVRHGAIDAPVGPFVVWLKVLDPNLQRLQKGQPKEPYKVRKKASQLRAEGGFGSRFCNLRIQLYGSTFCYLRLDIEW